MFSSSLAVGEATPLIWKDHFKTLLNRQAPSAPELEHFQRPSYAVNKKPSIESQALGCIQKMRNGKSGGDEELAQK
ncbi:hypothetical protein RB195_024709 [Necator americanus]|uniref:Uncharacterized protein n=1 Tax=Necator americanus TaxID=51031 RepID=A0ABR1ERF8_NECAM